MTNKTNQDKIMEYLLLHRNHGVCLDDIARGTKIEREGVLGVVDDLAKRSIVGYIINPNNPESKKYFREYGNVTAKGVEKWLKESE